MTLRHAALAAVLLLAACSENADTGRRQLAFVPDSQLAQMADQSWAQMRQTAAVSADPALNARLARVATPIIRATGRDDLAWEFVVFEGDALNAFVLPNGKVGVFRGMMEFAQADDQLAAVIGHEAAHIIARHPAERVSQQLAAQAGVGLAQVILGGENGENADLVAGVFGLGAEFGVLLPHSRKQELEADRIGVDLMRKTGHDPAAAVTFWRRMSAHQARQGQPLEALSTHPADDRRIAELQAAINPAASAG